MYSGDEAVGYMTPLLFSWIRWYFPTENTTNVACVFSWESVLEIRLFSRRTHE